VLTLKKLLFVIIVLTVTVAIADPMFLITEPNTAFSLKLYNTGIQINLFKCFFYTTVPVDTFIGNTDRPELIKAVISTESSFFIHAVSPVGAMGLAQLNQITCTELGVSNAFNPWESVEASKRYLNTLEKRFGNVERALAAYFEGPTRVASQGPSKNGLSYAKKVLSKENRMKYESPLIRDVFVISPYFELGDEFSVGCYGAFSIMGLVDFEGNVAYGRDFQHTAKIYPRLNHNFAPVIGEENGSLLLGFSYQSVPDYGLEVAVNTSNLSFQVNGFFRLWDFRFTLAMSGPKFYAGVVK